MQNPPTSSEEIEVIKRDYLALGAKELAARLNRHPVTIARLAREQGIYLKGKQKRLTQEQIQAIKDQYLLKGPVRLARELGTCKGTVISVAQRAGLKVRKTPHRFTNSDTQKILEEYLELGPEKLAEAIGAHPSVVCVKANQLGLTRSKILLPGRKTFRAERHFLDTWTPESAYIIGFTYADGSVSKDKNYVAYMLDVRDLDILEQIKTKTSTESEIKIYSRGSKRQASLCIYCKEWKSRLAELGCLPAKTYLDTKFPDVPNEMLGHFLRGAFDGDGCISKSSKGLFSFSYCGSLSFVKGYNEKLAALLGRAPNLTRPNKKTNPTCWSFSYSSKKDMSGIFYFLYRDSQNTLRGARKFKRWVEYMFKEQPTANLYLL